MTDNKNNFKKVICPLPWMHANFRVDGVARLCCHGSPSVFDENLTINNIENYTEEILNSEKMKSIRNTMMDGKRPSECQNCYAIEDAGGRSVRQRHLHTYGIQDQVKLKNIQIALSNECNLKCTMCWPVSSNRLIKEFDLHGFSYDKTQTINAGSWNEGNVLKFIHNNSEDLESLFISGGEPFINKIHKKILDLLIDLNISEKIKLVYNTNGTVLPSWLIEKWNNFKDVRIQISIEGVGKLNEYIRYGTKWDVLVRNLDKFQKLKNTKNYFIKFNMVMMSSNIFGYPETIKWLDDNTDIYSVPYAGRVNFPKHLSCSAMPVEMKNQFDDIIDKLLNLKIRNSDTHIDDEIVKSDLRHIISEINYYKTQPYDEKLWNEFVDYHKKLESTRNNNLSDIVPQFKPYW